MKYLLLSAIIWSSLSGISQLDTLYLNHNNIHALVGAGGQLFNNPFNNSSGFEYPANSGKRAIFSASDWCGGLDLNNQLKGSFVVHDSNTTDLFFGKYSPGPLTVTAGSGGANGEDFGPANIDAATQNEYNKVWFVTKEEIDTFKDWYSCTQNPNCNAAVDFPSYQIPNSLSIWPAHGDVSLNEPYYLAPFFDKNQDGMYNPTDGDYPEIKGHFCAFTIFNDKAATIAGTDAIGLEVHRMVYGYNFDATCSYQQPINNTLFVFDRWINRSTDTLSDFGIGKFIDFDLGFGEDDYIGCDVERGMLYAYNGDLFDDGNNGYGDSIPAVGAVLLKGLTQDQNGMDDAFGVDDGESINGVGYGNAVIDDEALGMTGAMLVPLSVTSINSYNLLRGVQPDGSPYSFNGVNTPFAFSGSSNSLGYLQGGQSFNGNFEGSSGNVAGDRRAVLSSFGVTLVPGAVHESTVAYVGGPKRFNGQQSVEALQSRVDSVRAAWNSCCNLCANPLSVSNTPQAKVKIYPNPSSDYLFIDGVDAADYQVYNLSGQRVKTGDLRTNKSIDISRLPNGLYSLHLLGSDEAISTLKFTVLH